MKKCALLFLLLFLVSGNLFSQKISTAPSFLPAPAGSTVINNEPVNPLGPNSQAYALCLSATPGKGLVKFNLNAPGTFTAIGATTRSFFASAIVNQVWYGIEYTTNQIAIFDTVTGSITNTVVLSGIGAGENCTGMTYDKTTGTTFISTFITGASKLYTLNVTTGVATLVGVIGATNLTIDIACSKTGILYGHNITSPTTNSQIVTINKTTGAETLVGLTGFNANYAQGMTADEETGDIYLAAYNNTLSAGQLRKVDLATGNTTLIAPFQSNAELDCFIIKGISDAGTLMPFNLNTPAASITVTTLPGSTETVTFNWDTSRANASYKWIFGSPNATSRQIVKTAGSNSLTLTLGELDNLLAGLGVAPNQQLVGQWDVWAFRNNMPDNDSLKAANGPRAITLKRGLPALAAFNLVTPADNSTITTSVFNGSPVVFNWNKSGSGAKYKLKFGVTLTTPLITIPSNNSGFDSTWTIPNNSLDMILATAGVNPGDQIAGVWSVYAYNGLDSLKAVQTWNLILKRQAKGDWIVAYDSSSANGRTSKDSVTYYLGSMGKTFDLFNKGSQTSTSAISFKGYKGVIWLGEGTSVMSAVQKDSIKAYLDAGTSGSKSKLAVFSEDFGYQFDRTGSTNIDSSFARQYLGIVYMLDRPASGAAQGLVGDFINAGQPDSTVGSWPDVLQASWNGGVRLYKFRTLDADGNGFGVVRATNNVAVMGSDIRALRVANDSPDPLTVLRIFRGVLNFVDQVPVELTSFTANANGNAVVLNWGTATETNNKGFSVERKSQNGTFSEVAFINGKGTTTETQNYMFTDKELAVGTYTYRLKQVDYNGASEYSSEINVDLTSPVSFSLSQNYPNPFNPSTTIKFTLAVDSKVSLKIFNILGEEVFSKFQDLKSGYHTVNFNGSSLSSGIYFYRLDATGTNGAEFTSVKKMTLIK